MTIFAKICGAFSRKSEAIHHYVVLTHDHRCIDELACCSQTAYRGRPVRRMPEAGESDHESRSVASKWDATPDEDAIWVAAVC
jgi:hypothetical protein